MKFVNFVGNEDIIQEKLPGFKLLTYWGNAQYWVSPNGNIVHYPSGEIPKRRNDRDQVYLPNFMPGRESEWFPYPVGSIVAATWWHPKYDSLVNQSPYYRNILQAREFFNVEPDFRRKLSTYSTKNGQYWISKNGEIWGDRHFKKVISQIRYDGYPYLSIGSLCGVTVHRLVAETFIPIPIKLLKQGWTKDTLEVNHIDGNKLNNQLSNLEWVTPQGNMGHASKTNLTHTTISDDMLEFIWKKLANNKTDIEISMETRIPASTIGNIRQGVSPRYRTNKYTWPNKSPTPDLNTDENMQIINDYNQGYSFRDLMKKHNCSDHHIRKLIELFPEKITRVSNYVKREGSTLNDETLFKIFDLLSSGKGNAEIENITGVSSVKIANIRARRIYKNKSSMYKWPEAKTINAGSRKDTEKKYLEIIDMLSNGHSWKDIREKYNCYDSTIVLAKKRYGHLIKQQ